LDHGVAGAGHALLGLLRADECFAAKGVLLPPPVRSRNHGADLTRDAGLNPCRLAAKLSASPPLPDPGPETIAAQVKWLRRGDPFLSDELRVDGAALRARTAAELSALPRTQP
jgi:hypothetical protein